jgi:hypothetical protein
MKAVEQHLRRSQQIDNMRLENGLRQIDGARTLPAKVGRTNARNSSLTCPSTSACAGVATMAPRRCPGLRVRLEACTRSGKPDANDNFVHGRARSRYVIG